MFGLHVPTFTVFLKNEIMMDHSSMHVYTEDIVDLTGRYYKVKYIWEDKVGRGGLPGQTVNGGCGSVKWIEGPEKAGG